MKRFFLRLAVGAAVLVVVGVGLWLARPDWNSLWSKLSASIGRVHAGSESKIAPPPEPDSQEFEPVRPSDPLSPIAARAVCGWSGEMLRPALPVVGLSSADVARRIGLRTAPAAGGTTTPSIAGNAEIAYNANLYGEVRPRVPGIIREVLADEGTPLQARSPMVIIDSAVVGSAKADLLAAIPVERLAQQTYDMVLALRKDNAAPLKDELAARAELNRARADVLDARQRLKNLGLSDSELARIELQQDTSTLLEIVSPLEGFVVDRHCVAGESVEPTDRLFVVADVHLIWAWIDVYESEIDDVRVGQPVSLTITGTEEPVFRGKVDWIDAAVNQATRTIRVRAEMENPEARLRAYQFGQARIQVGPQRPAVFLPRDAVQDVDGEQVVFLPLGEGRFQPRRVVAVRSGEGDGMLQVVWGLEAGQEVVTTGAFLLKSELLNQGAAGG